MSDVIFRATSRGGKNFVEVIDTGTDFDRYEIKMNDSIDYSDTIQDVLAKLIHHSGWKSGMFDKIEFDDTGMSLGEQYLQIMKMINKEFGFLYKSPTGSRERQYYFDIIRFISQNIKNGTMSIEEVIEKSKDALRRKGIMSSHRISIKSDYYDNPDRILIGVDINTHLDLFEDSYTQYTGKQFDWDRDGEDFNKASAELDRIVENNFATKLGHKAVEEFHDGEAYDISVYHCTFWGDRNNQNDIEILQELQGQADDKWTDNGRVELAIYNGDVYSDGSCFDNFAEKWGDMGAALAGSITVGVDFPEEFDSEPDYDNVNGLHTLKNSKQIKSSRKTIKSSIVFDNGHSDDYNYYSQYKVEDEDTLNRIKEYLSYNEDELQLGNVYINFMYDKETKKLLVAQVVDTESSTWDLYPEQVGELFGKKFLTIPENSVTSSRKTIKSSAQFVYMSDMKPKNWTKKISNAAIKSNVQNCGYYDYFGKKGLCLKGSYDSIKEFMEKYGRFDPSSIYSDFKWDKAEMLQSVKSGAELEGAQKDDFIKKAMKIQGYSDKEANQMINQSKRR